MCTTLLVKFGYYIINKFSVTFLVVTLFGKFLITFLVVVTLSVVTRASV